MIKPLDSKFPPFRTRAVRLAAMSAEADARSISLGRLLDTAVEEFIAAHNLYTIHNIRATFDVVNVSTLPQLDGCKAVPVVTVKEVTP